MLNRHEHINCRDKIEGYYLPRVNEGSEQAFDRAKDECIEKLNAQLDSIKEFSFDDFCKKVK